MEELKQIPRSYNPELDRCPVCNMRIRDMLLKYKGIFRLEKDNGMICMKCGNHFTPLSVLDKMISRQTSLIIIPN